MKKRLAMLGFGFLQIIVLGFVTSCPGSYEFQGDTSFDRHGETTQGTEFVVEENEMVDQTDPVLLTFEEAERVCQRFSVYTEFPLGKNSPLRFVLYGASEIPYCVWLNRIEGDVAMFGSEGVLRRHDEDLMSLCVEKAERDDEVRLLVITSDEYARVALRLERGWTK